VNAATREPKIRLVAHVWLPGRITSGSHLPNGRSCDVHDVPQSATYLTVCEASLRWEPGELWLELGSSWGHLTLLDLYWDSQAIQWPVKESYDRVRVVLFGGFKIHNAVSVVNPPGEPKLMSKWLPLSSAADLPMAMAGLPTLRKVEVSLV